MEKTNKMSTKKVIAILAAIFLICGGALALLVIARNYTKTVASEEKYEYFNPDETKAKPDDGFVIDGVLDEEQYKKCNWLKLQNDQGGAGVDLAMTSFYGKEGMYIVYDVTESSPIYVNLERESYMNSGIEMYLALSDVTSMASNKVFEIDLLPTGDMNFRQRTGKDNWVNVASTDEIMAYLGATTKGGPVNTEECSGYNLELFIPWAYMDKLGMNASEMKQNFVYINPVHITSYNLTGTESGTDRYWYAFATQLGSDGWNDVAQYFRFAERGVLGTVPIELVKGANYKISGNDSVIPGMMTTIQITPEKGYALNSILVNGEEYIKKISYNKDGSVTLKVRGVKEGLTISASAEPVTEGNKTLSGIVQVHKLGGDTLEGVSVSYKGPGGEKPIEFNSNGKFELKDLKQGYYTITAEKKGYAPINRGIYLNRDIETELTLEYQMFEAETGYNWILDNQNDGVLNRFGGSGKILSVDSYKKFAVEANFKYDTELAAMSDGDTFLQQRSGIQIKFSNGKYWRVDLMKEKDVFKVQYAKHNDATVFNWKTVHELTKEEIAKYQSEDGIKLSILRDGNYAWVCLNGKPVAIEVLDDEYKNCTAQIGFEGWVANQEIEEMNYNISSSFKQNLKNFHFTTSGKWDISRQLEGVVSLPGGGTHVLPFYKEYTDIDLTLKNVKEHDKTGKKPGRTDVLFEFDTNGDGKVDKSVSFGIVCTDSATKTCWVQTLGSADNYLPATRIKGLYKLSAQEAEKYLNGDGVEFRVVRKGTEVYLFVEGEEVAIFDLTQNNSGVKAATKAKVSLRHYDAEGDVVLPFTVTDKVEKVKIDKIFKDNEKWDLTKQFEGIVSLPGGGTDTSLQFFKKYQNIDLTITAKENDKTGKKPGRTDVLFEFDLNNDGTMDKNVSFGVVQLSNGSCEIQTLGWNEKFIPEKRINALYQLDYGETLKYKNEGINLRVVRYGADVFLYVDGRQVAVFDLTQNNSGVKADSKATVILRHYDAVADSVVIPFKVTDQVTKPEVAKPAEKIFKDNFKWDLSKQLEGVVALPGGGTQTLEFYKQYTNMDLTLKNVKENGNTTTPGRTDVLYEFDTNNDGKTDKSVSFGVTYNKTEKVYKIETLGIKENHIPVKRQVELYKLNDAEITKYMNDGIEFRLIRYETEVYVYVEGEQVAIFDLTQNNSGVTADMKAKVSIRHYDAKADNVVIPFEVTEEVVKPEVKKIFKDNSKWDLSKQFDGEVTLPGGGTQTLEFYKKYTDFDLTLKNVKEYGNTTTPGRTDVLFEFDKNNDGTYDKSVSFGVTYNKTQKRYKVETLGISSNFIPEKRQTELYRLDNTEIAKYLNEGIELRVIRYGAYVSVYVEGECVANFDLTQNNSGVTANMEAKVSLRHYDAKTNNAVFPFELSDTVEKIFKDNSKWNLEKQFGGVVSLPGGGTNTSLQFAKKYKNFDLTIMAKEHAAAGKAAGRTDVLLEFDVNVSGGIWKNTSFGILKRSDGVYVETLGWAQNHIPAQRANQLYKLSDEEAQKYLTDGIELRILRYGKDVYIYVDGKAVATFDLSQNNSGVTADMEAMVGLRHYDAVADNVEIPFTITETIEKIFKDNGKWDLTKQLAGEVALTEGIRWQRNDLVFAKKYTKMDVSVIARENDTSGNTPGRTDILFEFDVNVSGGVKKNTSFGILKRSDGVYVETLGWNANFIPAVRANILYKLNDAEAAKYMNEGVELRVVRYGTDAFIYVEGKYITTFDLSQNNSGVTADMEATVTLRHYDAVAKNIVIPFAVSDKVDLEELRLYSKKAEVRDYAYSFAVIPDTQIVAENDVKNGESNFAKIYDWILANKTSKNIQYVFGLGDITDNNNIAEWTLAKSQIERLDGQIPYSVIRGNHDLLGWFEAEDKTADYMTQYLGTDAYKGQFANGGFYSDENIWNSWRTFKVGNVNYLMLALDYGPSDEVLSWASNVIAAHPAHNVIITTHAYLFRDGTTLDSNDVCPPVGSGGSNNGDHIWDKLVSKHENIVLVMSGHDPSENIIVSKDQGVNGNTVTSMLIDAQDVEKEEGSLGMVAMLYFSEDGKNIEVEYYSTTEGKFFTTESQFKTTLDVVEDADVYGTGYVPVKGQQVKTQKSFTSFPRTIEVTFNRANLTNRSIILGSCDGKTTDFINLEAPVNEKIIYLNTTLNGTTYRHSFNTVSIPTNEIVRVTVVIEDAAIKCYVNGKLAQTRTASNGGDGSKSVAAMLASAANAKLPVGYGFGDDLRNTDDHYFKGTIYDIALWSDVRTASEIATSSISNVNTDNYKDNLIAAYDFRAGYNSTAGQNPFNKDLSVNGYHLSGTLNVGTSHIPLSGMYATTPITKGTNFTATTNKKTLAKNAYTVSAWVYLPSAYAERGGGIFSNYKNSNTSCASFEIYTNGMPRFYHINGNKEVVNLGFSKVTICADKWVHLTFVVSGKTVSCYKDGVLAQTVYSDKIDMESVNPEYVIGGDLRDGNGQYFKGRMLQIDLFENALSAKEVKRLYNAGADKTGKNALAIYEYLITE